MIKFTDEDLERYEAQMGLCSRCGRLASDVFEGFRFARSMWSKLWKCRDELMGEVREARWWAHFLLNRIHIHDTSAEMLADIADAELPAWLKETDGREG